jgi:nucleotide-binding universal stress UspA family protein
MFRSILVPLDGSAFGEQALPLALSIARRAGAELHLLHVHQPVVVAFAEGPLLVGDQLDQEIRQRQQAYLDAVLRRLAAVSPVTARPVLLEGEVVPSLRGLVASAGVDLIVMTTHGRGPLARFWLGSVADELVRHLTVPVLLVRPREGKSPAAAEPPRHFLVPLDGSPLAERILEPAAKLAGLLGADCTLLRVVQPVYYLAPELGGFGGVGPDPKLLRDLQAEAEAYLGAVAARLRQQGWPAQTEVRLQPHVPRAVLETAEARGCDLIALATHGRGGLGRALRGSVADKVIRGGVLPVLVYRPGDSN